MAGKPILQTPYATAVPYLNGAEASPTWYDEYDRQRIASYDLYDDMYNNDPTQFGLMLRGADDGPVFVPLAKRTILGLSRYVGKNWGYKVLSTDVSAGETDPTSQDNTNDAIVVTPEQVQLAQETYSSLFKRERLLSVFRSGIPEWLRRGDWLWMVSADETKRSGRRISVKPIDPRRYFPLFNDRSDVNRVTGQQLIEEIFLEDGTAAMFVQTWLKASDPSHPDYGTEEPEEGFDITYEAQAYDVKDFGLPEKRKALAHPDNVPQEDVIGIHNLPIYHIRNNESTDDPYGRSDLSGLESMLAGVNQSVTDEDLSLAFMGLGMYHTDSGAPVDETTGQPTNWKLGPKRVIEHEQGTKFEKVDGINSIQPFQEHVAFLKNEALGTIGMSDVALGEVGTAAFSGIALAIRFAPTADTVRVKNDNLNGVMTQMFFDLKDWFKVYEGIDLGDIEVISETDDQDLLPFDRAARWKELTEGLTAGIFTPEYVVSVLETDFGYTFPADYLQSLDKSNSDKAAAMDPFAARAAAEAQAAAQAQSAQDAQNQDQTAQTGAQ